MRHAALFTCAISATLIACGPEGQEGQDGNVGSSGFEPVARGCPAPDSTPVRLPGGSFLMGADEVYAEEGPVRETTVDGFWIDPHEVTNRQFAEFVAATGYVTVAEKPVDPALFGVPVEQIPPELLQPGSAVFTPPGSPARSFNDWWTYLPGADWQKPQGPQGPDAHPGHPVVHLGRDDMLAYAEWKGGRLPTEAEWEYAASAGAQGRNIQPGNVQPAPDQANTWQGSFPAQNTVADGFPGVAPVGCFPANDFGLHDMVGNVWEVTADFYRPGHDPEDRHNPTGPPENDAYDPINPGLPGRVMKGGSYLCAPNYCMRYRPAARQASDPGLGASNVGFRLVYDEIRAGAS